MMSARRCAEGRKGIAEGRKRQSTGVQREIEPSE